MDAYTIAFIILGVFVFFLWQDRSNRLKAKWAVIREWDSWAARNPEEANTILGGRRFFQYLQQERPDLLDFRVGYGDRFDKGLVVHRWLLSKGRVKD